MWLQDANGRVAIYVLGTLPHVEEDLYDLLDYNRWRVPTRDESATLTVTELGTGPAVITLHGGPGLHFGSLVDVVRGHLNRARFILFDQRGSLMSPVAPDQMDRVTLPALIDDIDLLRAELGQGKVVLLGHSWGTQLALHYLAAHPDRVAGLILLGTTPPYEPTGDTDSVNRQEALRHRPEVQAEIHAAGLDGERLSRRQESLKYQITGLAACTMYRVENWRRVRPGYWNRAVAEALDRKLPTEFDIRPALIASNVPVAVIQGDQDYVDPAASYWRPLAHGSDQINITVLKDTGHNSWLDDPLGFAQALTHALDHIGAHATN